MKTYFLKPGELYAAADETEITTLLGSCIAVCIWDRKLHQGGMCHYYLPYASKSQNTPNHYGEIAIVNLLRQMKNMGSAKRDLVAKILGGARVVAEIKLRNFDIGEQNTVVARETMARFRIPVAGENVGGHNGRKVKFNTRTGAVRYTQVDRSDRSEELSESGPVRVLIVDDSKPVRMLLRKMIEDGEGFVVVGEAADAEEAAALMHADPPDVITLDIRMPGKDGITFLSEYMRTTPIPTVMISSLNPLESGEIFRALELGALDYIQKPSLADFAEKSQAVKLILGQAALSRARLKKPLPILAPVKVSQVLPDEVLRSGLIAIGASTGGTEAIRHVLASLPRCVPPIVIVQHIPNAFSRAFAERLDSLCAMKVVEAQDGMILESSMAYVAPGDSHMVLVQSGGIVRIRLNKEQPVNRFRPSVDVLFRSVACLQGLRIVGVILTGMGSDGARGLLEMKQRGARTIAQNEDSAIVDGMPRVARELGAADEVVSLDGIALKILKMLM